MSENWNMPNVPAPVTADHCEIDTSRTTGHIYLNCKTDGCVWEHDCGWLTDLGEVSAVWLLHLEAVHR